MAPSAKRRLLADFVHLRGESLGIGKPPSATRAALPDPNLVETRVAAVKMSPRMRQTLDRLLAGDSEKQVAAHLSVSKNTVHVYVKAVYRAFKVSSRGELLAHFIRSTARRGR